MALFNPFGLSKLRAYWVNFLESILTLLTISFNFIGIKTIINFDFASSFIFHKGASHPYNK